MRRRTTAAFSILAVSLTSPVVPLAGAATSVVPIVYTTGPHSDLAGWYEPAAAVPINASWTFVNADVDLHDIAAVEAGPDTQPWCSSGHFAPGTCPKFYAKSVGLGSVVVVQGLDALTPGQSYGFVCILHPRMVGTLTALPPLPT